MVLLGRDLEFSWIPLAGILPGRSQNGSLRAMSSTKAAGRDPSETGGLSPATQSWLGLHWEKLHKHRGLELTLPSPSASTTVKDPNTGLPWLWLALLTLGL